MFSSTTSKPTPPDQRQRINLYISSNADTCLFNNQAIAPEIKFTKDMDFVVKNSTEKSIIFQDSKGQVICEVFSKNNPNNACVIVFPSNFESGIYTYKFKENSESLGSVEKLN
jgi:hypothetical protein